MAKSQNSKSPIQIFAKIGLLIFLYYIVYAFYVGILHPVPAPGDSFDYHIPISQSILNGSFIHPAHQTLPQRYYPGSSEAINALFILFHIPLTLSNLFAILVLFISLIKLGQAFKLDVYFSLLFAEAFCTTTAVIRWANAVSIDMWVAVFFVWGIILLMKPQKSVLYFARLGFVLGMLLGSKYMAVVYVAVLVLIYGKRLIPVLKFSRVLAFLVPFFVFGLFWYIRNGVLFGNPLYPLCYFSLPCVRIFSSTVWQVTLSYPITMLNSVFGDYKLWIIVPFVILYVAYQYLKKTKKIHLEILFLAALGAVNFVIYFFYPTSSQPWIMVSSLRYSYSAFIPLMLLVFIFGKQLKKEEWLSYVVIATMLVVPTMAYYPKLLVIFLPLSFIALYLLKKYATT